MSVLRPVDQNTDTPQRDIPFRTSAFNSCISFLGRQFQVLLSGISKALQELAGKFHKLFSHEQSSSKSLAGRAQITKDVAAVKSLASDFSRIERMEQDVSSGIVQVKKDAAVLAANAAKLQKRVEIVQREADQISQNYCKTVALFLVRQGIPSRQLQGKIQQFADTRSLLSPEEFVKHLKEMKAGTVLLIDNGKENFGELGSVKNFLDKLITQLDR